ncbi:winged helix-turn-helix domain-containing protein [Hyphococcus sp.]|uniref:winged helix-turn-helix domain-containing protein n=1 Tax=Hyphococcus sp. TaxID=2038636 RepID=UPI0020876573|nr:MAG: hypothetical protein DHS20C04_05900 [Marinicaulis sp.]
MNEVNKEDTGAENANSSDAMGVVSFGAFDFDCDKLELRKDDVCLQLKHQPARLLKILLEYAPETVPRTLIYKLLWDNGTTVEFDQNLNACVRQLRSAIGDSATEPQFIETLPKRGYRFISPVKKKAANPFLKWVPVGVIGIVAILVLAVFLLVKPERLDAIHLYVPPVAVEDDGFDVSNGLIQYSLRLAIIDRLASGSSDTVAVVNGESLWGDAHSLGLRKKIDYRLSVKLHVDGTAHSALASLISEGGGAPYAQREFPIATIDAVTLTAVAADISQWAAEIFGAGLRESPVSAVERNSEYYDAILRSKRARQIGNPAALVESLEWAQKAQAIEPSSSEAKGAVAMALAILAGSNRYPVNDTYDEALALADDIRNTTGATVESELVRGFVSLYHRWDLRLSEEAFDIALELAPGDPMVYAWRSGLLAAKGDAESAANAADIAVSLDPLSMSIVADRCWFLNAAERHREAVDACRWALEMQPENYWATMGAVEALSKLGRGVEAAKILNPILEKLREADRTRVYDMDGLDGRVLTALQQAQCELAWRFQPRAEEYSYPFFELAAFWAQCGDFEASAKALVRAKKAGESGALFYPIDSRLEAFRRSAAAAAIDMTISIRQNE